jgi:hypothetical protein
MRFLCGINIGKTYRESGRVYGKRERDIANWGERENVSGGRENGVGFISGTIIWF